MKAANKSRSGMVLIMVAGALAVMMILLLALLQGTSSQVGSAQSAATRAREKMLADSAMTLVIGQITQASTKTGQAWISQPGLLRTYGATATRKPTACYKLYSTSTLDGMLDTSGKLDFYGTDVPATWSSAPALYTDLNGPARTTSGKLIYPILDPAALTTPPTSATGSQVTGVSSDTGAVTMPVAWLYQLQDGSLGPATNGTPGNPIVARIAFWTDDETSKININTAGCGTPWNTPHLHSTDDVTWSNTQPATGEFSAYPGHPATTSLAVVFGSGASPLSPQQLLGLTPRYGWGGSQMGAQPTTTGESVAAKTDRLYASLDELTFGSAISSGQRQANPITPAQLETTRFVLTAHSVAPETTLLGEPRFAIWPVADSTSASTPRLSATDRAIMSAATVGTDPATTRTYYFQRNDPENPQDNFDPAASLPSSATTSNLQFLSDLLSRGKVSLPGYGAALTAKYPDPKWTQLMLEITDFIRALNPIDSNPAITPFAGGDAETHLGHGFVVPLTTTYGSGASAMPLRGLGRCPTLSSLTLVFYVCGFGFDSASHLPAIDYEQTPDTDGSSWSATFKSNPQIWQHVTSELIRAFVVPCTFQPGCAYPEVCDDCDIQISGLDAIGMTTSTANNFGFTSPLTSPLLGDSLQVAPTDRAWGGNEGPLAWRAAAFHYQQSGTFTYPFAGSKAFTVTLPTKPGYNSTTGVLTWPPLGNPTLVFHGVPGLTVLIRDKAGHTLQTLNVNLPANVGVPAPTPVAEYSQDGAGNPVAPSYYMTLKNRVLAEQDSRPFLIQPGDTSRSVEAATDLRTIAALSNVPAKMFAVHPSYSGTVIPHAHNLRFADGTAVYGASGVTTLAATTYATPTKPIMWTDWTKNSTVTYALSTATAASCPTKSAAGTVTMLPVQNINGDWDTGIGFSPDGAQIGLPDSGTSLAPDAAYFSLASGQVGAPTQRTPNAFIPSPVIFGSLPAGVDPNDSLLAATNPTGTPASEPWRTLLFCPYPASNTSATPYTNHPGAITPPDHLILDNFWMPVVEPYPISTCMATAGKINLNDQIAPFTYLHRSTALRALLDDLRIPAIPLAQAATYKTKDTPLPGIWNAVDEDATVAQIENKFAGASVDAYLSENEICTVPLVPVGQKGTSVADTQAKLLSFWNGNAGAGLTGDNLRELPYAQLYSRLTTRSNSYIVHVRVQVLQKLPRDPNQNIWNEGTDLVLGDWRGSYEIERYLDPAAKAPAAGTALGPYKFRILSARQFAP